ncbi:MAG: tetratricopeptide repeat protein [Blastocatellia bacterium]
MTLRTQNVLRASALCVLILATAASAQTSNGNTLIGKVRTESGRSLPNVLVELQTGNGVLITQTVTTNEGDYVFSGLTGASFVVVVNEPTHQPFSERIELTRTATTRPGEMVRVDLVLTPKEKPATPRAGTVFHQDVPEAALKSYRHGMRLFGERKSDEGIAAMLEAIRVHPTYFDAHFALGLEFFRRHRLVDSIQELEQARAINPKDGRLYHTFGLVLYEQKKYATAATVFEAAQRLDPNNAELHLMRGAALIETGRLKEAEAEISRADQISAHKLALVHLHLARVYEKRGNRKQAAAELESYLRQSPAVDNAPAIREAIKKLKTD